jgi:hypothetical protein
MIVILIDPNVFGNPKQCFIYFSASTKLEQRNTNNFTFLTWTVSGTRRDENSFETSLTSKNTCRTDVHFFLGSPGPAGIVRKTPEK